MESQSRFERGFMAPEKNNKGNDFFVCIAEAREIRVKLLESSKTIIKGLRDYESIRAVRQERYKRIIEFKEIIKDIKSQITGLKERLPKHEFIEAPEVPAPAEKEEPRATIPKQSKKASEIMRLEKDLSEIEARLSNI